MRREIFESFSLDEHVAVVVAAAATIFVPLAANDDTNRRCWDVFVVAVRHVVHW